ncbi:flagellar biosynthesis protein FlhF [Stenotrophomonas sp. MMGLT7]|uniref:flagellar biosynthesis protein FlhF n=1 Tax=Stenotrophomonas sp. MMGLT7 TaxID=2901227 RepID=UPI001E38F633|nr:flagellar biosynthesis protein FlhF [Stenotrophomonas sp. MMGLT7]MCD7099451.1 flagellar biosynthesis protein FlhF [Stenotrophomonas sp. MMGLT7]
MKIKRFVAPDMRTAFRMVRDEHGPDAVILSNRRTAEGVEIVAASNYDEDLVQRALQAAQPPAAESASAPAAAAAPLRTAAPSPAEAMIQAIGRRQEQPAAALQAPATPPQQVSAPLARPAAEPGPAPAAIVHSFAQKLAQSLPPAPPAAPAALATVPAAALPAPQNDEQLTQLREELALMRQMIEREMNRLTDERLRGSPVRAQALALMDDYGFDAGLTRDVALQIPADTPLPRGRGLMLGLLSKRLPIAPVDPLDIGGVIALIGPTGAGKTTTIAKLAARFAEKHSARDIALVTTDILRVGGREQLHSYGRQLGIAVHEADSDAGLIALLERLADYKLVLIDTAGMGQRDRALAAQLGWLRAARQVTSLLVLPANAHFADLDEVARRFAGARPQGVVLTKLDETGRLGSALSVVVDHQLPITWVTDGQHVPQDLHRANAASLVLRLEDLRRAADKPSTPEQNHAVA